MQYIVERPSMARNGKRAYVLDNGTTSDISKATRMDLETAQYWARIFWRSSGIRGEVIPVKGNTWAAAVLALQAQS